METHLKLEAAHVIGVFSTHGTGPPCGKGLICRRDETLGLRPLFPLTSV